MIYILKAPGAMCSYCQQECSKSFQTCEGPIGGYLFLTLLLNVPAALCALIAISDPEVTRCKAADLAMLCKVDLLVACTNILFATYLKVAIEAGEASDLQAHLNAAGQRQPRFRRIRTGVRNLVLYDVKTCVYIFVFCFSVIWNVMGSTWISPCRLSGVAPSSMISLEVAFAVLSVVYVGCSVVFVNCTYCYDSVQNSRWGPWSFSDVLALIRSCVPVVEAICGRAQKRTATPEQGESAHPQVLVGVPVAHVVHPAPSAPPASFAAPAPSAAPPVQTAQALDTRRAMAEAA